MPCNECDSNSESESNSDIDNRFAVFLSQFQTWLL